VLVRLPKISGADLNVFDFDYDVTWMAFFLNADEKIYGRYGGRDASGPDSRLSLAGFKYALSAALEAHRRDPGAKPEGQPAKPLYVDDYPAAKRFARGECIHCHQVYEIRREHRRATGQWQRDEAWVYPLPENVGLTLEVDRGNHVRAVAAESPAARAGLKPGDVVQTLNDLAVASFADAQYALHRAPAKGSIPLSWLRDGRPLKATVEVADGWRRTNPTWRTSMLDILPSLAVYGEDLGAAEKKALGLSEKRLAFRQEKPKAAELLDAGLREGDVIVGVDGQAPEMTMLDFLGYVRRNYLIGERITLNVIRNGKRLDLPLTLR
jgi:hypothetical protein